MNERNASVGREQGDQNTGFLWVKQSLSVIIWLIDERQTNDSLPPSVIPLSMRGEELVTIAILAQFCGARRGPWTYHPSKDINEIMTFCTVRRLGVISGDSSHLIVERATDYIQDRSPSLASYRIVKVFIASPCARSQQEATFEDGNNGPATGNG